jgi:MFS family permease
VIAALRLRGARRATATVFVLLGVVQGTLASRMPALKAHAALSDGLLGLALLGVPLGSILAVQVTGRWMARRGSAPVTVVGAVIMCATAVAPAYATSFGLLAGALVLLGVGIGLTDTAMNAHAVLVEKGHARPIMASFHAFASLGNLVGAVLGAGAGGLAGAPSSSTGACSRAAPTPPTASAPARSRRWTSTAPASRRRSADRVRGGRGPWCCWRWWPCWPG